MENIYEFNNSAWLLKRFVTGAKIMHISVTLHISGNQLYISNLYIKRYRAGQQLVNVAPKHAAKTRL